MLYWRPVILAYIRRYAGSPVCRDTVSSGRQNALALDKSGWWRLAKDIKYHPYKAIRRQELNPADLPRRLQFC